MHMDKQQVLRKEERFIQAPYSGPLTAPAIQDYRLPTADDIVQISGLSRRPELNGSVGRVAATGYDDQNRVLIFLDSCTGGEGAAARPRHMRVSVTRLKLLRHEAAPDTDATRLHSSKSIRSRFRAPSDTRSLRGSVHSERSQSASLALSQTGSSLPSTRAPSDAGSPRSSSKAAPWDGSLAHSSRTALKCSSADVGEVHQVVPREELNTSGSSRSMRPLTAGSGRLRPASSIARSLTRLQSDRPEHSLQISKEEPRAAAAHLSIAPAGMAQDGDSNSQQNTRPRSASLISPTLSSGANRRSSSAKPSVRSNTSMRS